MDENFSRLNWNKLYSGIFSTVQTYTFMTIFELVFFVFIVRPVIVADINNLLKAYTKNKQPQLFNVDPSPMLVANVMNAREYNLIDQLNFNSYLIIIILILLLISLLFYLYTKIGIMENVEGTEASGVHNDFGLVPYLQSPTRLRRSRSETTETEMELSPGSTDDNRTVSQISNRTRISIKQIYLKHAIKCSISTILSLIVFQIFFYNYGQRFLYIGSSNELIVLFVETIRNTTAVSG